MPADQTVTSFNYGSNSPDELRALFQESGAGSDFGFGGLVELRGTELVFGSKSQKRGCPVATLREAADTIVIGYIAFVAKKQFQAIARRECGNTMGRKPEKGRYRRAVIYFDDPRNPTREIQAVAFVLNERHPEFYQFPVDTEARTHQRIEGSAEASSFVEYTRLIASQRQQAQEVQQREFFAAPPLPARWHSREVVKSV